MKNDNNNAITQRLTMSKLALRLATCVCWEGARGGGGGGGWGGGEGERKGGRGWGITSKYDKTTTTKTGFNKSLTNR